MSGADEAQLAEQLSRRQVVGGGMALAATSVAAGALLAGAPAAQAQYGNDPATLYTSLELEQIMVLAYQLALDKGVLRGSARSWAQRIQAQEQAHAEALTTALNELSAKLPPRPHGIADVDVALPGLEPAATSAQVLAYLAHLERLAVYGYYLGVPRLYDQKLVQTATSIMCDEGQHLAILRGLLGQDPVPNALERGQEPPAAALAPLG